MSDEYAEIWLQPWCDGCVQHSGCEGRQWCQDDIWDKCDKCDECDERSVRYALAPQPPASPSRDSTDGEAMTDGYQLTDLELLKDSIFHAFANLPGPTPAKAIKEFTEAVRAEATQAERAKCVDLVNSYADLLQAAIRARK